MLPKPISKATNIFMIGENKESPYAGFCKGKNRIVAFSGSYPRHIFKCMVISIILSFVVVFLIDPFDIENRKQGNLLVEDVINLGKGASEEVSSLLEIGNRIGRMHQLKSEVERIIRQEKISKEDSIFLEKAITELENFNHLNPRNHED